jgi:hypothetical protein
MNFSLLFIPSQRQTSIQLQIDLFLVDHTQNGVLRVVCWREGRIITREWFCLWQKFIIVFNGNDIKNNWMCLSLANYKREWSEIARKRLNKPKINFHDTHLFHLKNDNFAQRRVIAGRELLINGEVLKVVGDFK